MCFIFCVGFCQNLLLPELDGPFIPSGLYRTEEGEEERPLYPKYSQEFGFVFFFFFSTKPEASIFHISLATACLHQISPA